MSDELGKRVVEERNIPGGDFKKGIHKFEDLDETEKRVQSEIRAEELDKLSEFQKEQKTEEAKRKLDEYKDQLRDELTHREEYRQALMNQIIEKSNGEYTRETLISESNTNLETILTALNETQQRGR